jgi:hypothetical protein
LGTESEADDFKDDEAGWAKRWQAEFEAADKALEDFTKRGEKVDAVFRDEREATVKKGTRWNLFSSNIQRMVATLYGNTPKADVSRRFGDATDDVGRVAGEIAERLLHTDLEKRGDTAQEAFGNALMDWLLPGAGLVRVRYAATFEPTPEVPAQVDATGRELVPAVPKGEKVASEEAPIDYVHWRDVKWSPCRVWSDLTWIAFAADMPKEDFLERFGEKSEDKEADDAAALALWGRVPKESRKEREEEKAADPWARARVWEIWHKESGKVFWYVKGFEERVLDMQEDPLQLDGFWPCPRPLFANLTTSKLVPVSNYYLGQDLYLEINSLSSRIDTLQRAIKVAGLYDASDPELARLLDEAVENQLLPSANWAAFAQAGGLKSKMDFLPLDQIGAALQQLRDYRRELIDALYQVTGWSDIMRGQASTAGVTATEQRIKAGFGSVLLQRMGDEFARFVSEAQELKLEVISKHFQPATIQQRSNAQYAFPPEDRDKVGPAIELLKSEYYCYRVEVKPESISQTDFAQLKQDRTEVIAAIGSFFQAAMPVVQAIGPSAMPFMLELLQAGLAGLRGSSTLEGVLDGAIEKMAAEQQQAAMQPKPPPPPDPKVQAQQLKMQGDAQKHAQDMEKEQFKAQADSARIQEETVAHDAMEQSQAKWGTKEQMDREMIKRTFNPPAPPGMPPKPGGF